jgi:DNA-directed RNA polymerase specialized sigma24 family protein
MVFPMADDPTGSVTQFFHQLQAGDADAARGLWERYFPRLVGLARHALAGRPQRTADAEDAALSAFVTFWQGAGGFASVLNRDDLWKLLGTIALRKALKQARRESTGKRGGGRVVGETGLFRPDGSPLPLDEAAGRLPPPIFDLYAAELLDDLDPESRTIALMRLLGHTNGEIAGSLGYTERTVERKLNLIRRTWEDQIPG